MNRIVLLYTLILASAIGDALADCTNNRVTGSAISTLLNNKLVCGRPAAGYTGSADDRWQEEHISGGNLFDFKKGPGDAIDPRVQVGTWNRSGNSVVYLYNRYTPNVTVTYGGIFRIGTTNTYSFCTGLNCTEVVRANIVINTNPVAGELSLRFLEIIERDSIQPYRAKIAIPQLFFNECFC